jgi:hypothetical protein
MKRWPDFNPTGDLPIGVHEATLSDVMRISAAGLSSGKQ